MSTIHPPAPLELLRRPQLGRFMLSGLCSYAVYWGEPLVTAWVALELTNSAMGVALTGFARMLPLFLFGLFAGLVADRFDRRWILAVVQTGHVLLAVGLTILYGSGQLQYWQLILAAGGFGLLMVVDSTTRRALASTLVEREAVPAVGVVDVLVSNVVKFIAPLVGGIVLDRLGPATYYAVLAVAGLASAGLLVGLVVPPGAGPRVSASLQGAFDGLRLLPSVPAAFGVIVITIGMNVLNFATRQLTPVFARDVLAAGAVGYGLIEAANGLGSLFGSLAMALRGVPRQMGRVFVLASIGGSLCLIGFATSRDLSLSLGLTVAMGVLVSYFTVMQFSILVTSVGDSMRGRILGTQMLAVGTSPLGHLLVGSLASQTGAPFAVALLNSLAIVWVLAAALLIPGLPRFTRSTPSPRVGQPQRAVEG